MANRITTSYAVLADGLGADVLKRSEALLLAKYWSLSLKKGYAYASRAHLAKLLALSESTVKRGTLRLEALGVISIDRRHRRSNHVTLNYQHELVRCWLTVEDAEALGSPSVWRTVDAIYDDLHESGLLAAVKPSKLRYKLSALLRDGVPAESVLAVVGSDPSLTLREMQVLAAVTEIVGLGVETFDDCDAAAQSSA